MNDRMTIQRDLLQRKRLALAILRHRNRIATNEPQRAPLDPEAILPPPVEDSPPARPMTFTEQQIALRWHPDITVHDIIAFKRRSGTGRFGIIRGGRAE